MLDPASLMIIASGAAHAVVNAILKAGDDKMSSRALIDGSSALILLPAAFLVSLPHGAWGWLFASLVIHLVYLTALIKAFELADMSAVYPIMRGSAPALAALVSVAIFGASITPVTIIGIAAVSTGTMMMALRRTASAQSIVLALVVGASIALYTVVDAAGVRAAPSAASYIVWIFLFDGLGIALLFALWRGPAFIAEARSNWKPGLIAGALSIFTYGLALWSYRLGDVPRLAALRETSILFALVISVFFLKERVTRIQVAAILVIMTGAVTLLLVQ